MPSSEQGGQSSSSEKMAVFTLLIALISLLGALWLLLGRKKDKERVSKFLCCLGGGFNSDHRGSSSSHPMTGIELQGFQKVPNNIPDA